MCNKTYHAIMDAVRIVTFQPVARDDVRRPAADLGNRQSQSEPVERRTIRMPRAPDAFGLRCQGATSPPKP